MKKLLLLVLVCALIVVSFIGCSSAPARDKQFYYGDIYFGMSKDDVKEIASGNLYDEDETILTYKNSKAPYTSSKTQTMYDFRAGKLSYIMVWYEGSETEIITHLKEVLTEDYGVCTEKEDTDGTIYYYWKTSLVSVTLDYDDVTSSATVLYSRIVFK